MAKRSMDIAHPKYDPELKPEPKSIPEMTEKPKSTPKKIAMSEATETPAKRDAFWPVYFVGIIIVAILAFFGVRAGAKLVDTWMDLQPSSVGESTAPSAEATDATVDTAAETTDTPPTTTETATSTDTAANTATPAPAAVTPAIDKSTIKIKILNGSGVEGAAAAGVSVLESAGFKVDATGNAKKFSYDTSYVYYSSGKQEQAQLVADALKDKYSITTEENSVADGYDALVVIGKK